MDYKDLMEFKGYIYLHSLLEPEIIRSSAKGRYPGTRIGAHFSF
jgi:hypothetical protein